MKLRRPSWLLPTPSRRDDDASGLRRLLTKLMQGEDLERSEAREMFGAALDERVTDAQLGGALVALAIKGETIDELAGMAEAMRARAQRIACRHRCFIDTAGTGSSHAKTFNVSTAAALVCAGAGLPVAKHGSRAATSRSGSADVLGALGVNCGASAETSERCLNEIGFCFLFAPQYHQATARVAQIRRQLGVHTTFNLLGPLTNPAGARRQMIGVWHESLLEPLAHVAGELGAERAWIVHGGDGLDEVTTAAETKVAEWRDGRVFSFTISPEDFGLRRAGSLAELRDGTPAENALLIEGILQNKSGPRENLGRDLVIANAAAALVIGEKANDLREAVSLAAASIASGAALRVLGALREETNR